MSTLNKLDEFFIQAGEVVLYRGIPVYLASDARVLGKQANFAMDCNRIVTDVAADPKQASG